MISAKIIADSVNPVGNRLTSLVCVFPRYILAEVNTHRALSRNSASSRAVPFATMLNRVQDDPFIPLRWMKDHKGMQGSEYFDKYDSDLCAYRWITARDKAIEIAKNLNDFGVTKQLVNRLLEPFMWHTAIISATEWENFFALRTAEGADIHFQSLANCILLAMRNSQPKELKEGEWHIPFGDQIDKERLEGLIGYEMDGSEASEEEFYKEVELSKVKIATARCARVSYINYEGKDDYMADFKLYDQLLQAGHMSPFEHCAQAISKDEYSGNFKGFQQLRKMIECESKSFKI